MKTRVNLLSKYWMILKILDELKVKEDEESGVLKRIFPLVVVLTIFGLF